MDPIYTTEKYCQQRNNNTTTTRPNSSELCPFYSNEDQILDKKYKEANIALLSLILLIGTCTLALALKKLRRSIFFGAYVSKLEKLFQKQKQKEIK